MQHPQLLGPLGAGTCHGADAGPVAQPLLLAPVAAGGALATERSVLLLRSQHHGSARQAAWHHRQGNPGSGPRRTGQGDGDDGALRPEPDRWQPRRRSPAARRAAAKLGCDQPALPAHPLHPQSDWRAGAGLDETGRPADQRRPWRSGG